jgi:hypothetical protein
LSEILIRTSSPLRAADTTSRGSSVECIASIAFSTRLTIT